LPTAIGELGAVIHVLVPPLAKAPPVCVGNEGPWACVCRSA